MTHYAIGDIQGCFMPLMKLLEQIQFDPDKDIIWSTGDLVNRGPQSLEVLRFFQSLGEQHQIVLGNHDLHLLAVAYGAGKQHSSDTLLPILTAPDREELLTWLRHRPLLVHDAKLGYVMSHAGLAPMWSVQQAKTYAQEVEVVLRSAKPDMFFTNMYGNLPDHWDSELQGTERLRCIINYLTRMRFCYADGRLNLEYKGTVQHKPAEVVPWFELPLSINADDKIIFGHWAALNGETNVPNIYALDTGCVWGNCLSAMRLSDGKRYQVRCA